MNTRWFSISIRLIFGLIALLAGAFMSVGSAFAEERKPEPRVRQVAEEAVDATAPIHVATNDAQGQPCTFDALFAVLSNSSIRAVFTNVTGACDGVRATGEVTAEGYAPIVVDEQVREARYPGIKLGVFPDLPYDTATVTFRIKLGTMELPPITLQHKHAPVHVWLNFPEWPNKCVVNGPFKNDPGFVISDNGRELKREWFSAESGDWGPIALTGNGTHNLTIETYKPRNGKPQWDKVNQVLTASFEADCNPRVDPPVFEARSTVDCDQNWRLEILKQDRVAEVRWFVDGQPIDAPSGKLGDAQAIEVLARVVGSDGKSYEYRYPVNRNDDSSCKRIDPEFAFEARTSIDCKQDWQIAIVEQKNVASVAWFADGQPLAELKGNLGDAQSAALKARVSFTDGSSKDYDYMLERQAACPTDKIFRAQPTVDCENFNVALVEQQGVASVAWTVNGQPAAQPQGKVAGAQTINVHADVTFVDGTTAGYDYVLNAPADCSIEVNFHATQTIDCDQNWAIAIDRQQGVQSVTWSANGKPLAQLKGNLGKAKSLSVRAHVVYIDGRGEEQTYPIQARQGCGKGKALLASSNQVECALLPGSNQYGLIKYKTFDNLAHDGGDWRLRYGEFSLDGTTWTRFDSKRFGLDPRSGDIGKPQWVNWTVGRYVDGVFTGEVRTVRDSLPGFDAASQDTWNSFDYPIDWSSGSFLKAGKPEAIQAIGNSIAACTPPPPPTPITVCIQGLNGPEQVTFADGKIPEGMKVLERCETRHEVTKLTACTGWDVIAKRGIFRAFTVKEEYERAIQEQNNRCRPPEAAGTRGKSPSAHAHLRVRGVDADVTWLEEQGNFATNLAAQHRWNSKRIVSLHYFGKGRGLEQVRTGNEITWSEGGNVVTYRVKEIKVVQYNGAEYGAPESLVADDGIMLMTCFQPKSTTSIEQTLMIIGERVR